MSDTRGTEARLELIREALRILDGEEPDEIVCEGDGWSLLDPDHVGARRQRSLRDAVSAALDEAVGEGWLEEPVETELPPAAAGPSPVDDGWCLPDDPGPQFWRRYWAKSA